MPKANVDDAVSLFPFMSILAAVIGILVLIIAAVALGNIGRDAEANADAEAEAQAQARVDQYKQAQQQREADRKEIERLEKLLAEATKVQAELTAAEQKRQRLAAERSAQEKKLATENQQLSAAQGQADKLQKEIVESEKTLSALLEQLEKLRAELANRKLPPEPPKVKIQPSGTAGQLRATFVECAAGSIVLYDGPEPVRVPSAQIGSNPPFLALLDKVKQTDKGSVIFLVRPTGIGTYNTARNVARGRYVTNGKLAVAGEGQIDLSLFRK